jgi:dTMP kinase
MINHDGVYIVFEGVDFTGKTTAATNVKNILHNNIHDADTILTKHPGATPLGQHLRKLVKTPAEFDTNIKVDPISAQLLMMVDQICFINTILWPNLNDGNIVLADRSNFVSAIAYGIPEGVTTGQLNKTFRLADSPAPDRIFILSAPWETIEDRMRSRGKEIDRFEDNGNNYLKQVADIYRTLIERTDLMVLLSDYVPIENIRYIDATQSAEAIAKQIAAEVQQVYQYLQDAS